MSNVDSITKPDIKDIATKVEENGIQLEYIHAILLEVMRYFEKSIEWGTLEADALIRKAGHIQRLLYVTGDLLSPAIKENKHIVDILYEMQ